MSSCRGKIHSFGVSYNGSMNGWGSFGLGSTPSTPTIGYNNMAGATKTIENISADSLIDNEILFVPSPN